MNREQIESALRGFIDKTLMEGQGADLTSSTPLFQYGILDSFALFGLINFIEEEFSIPIQLEHLRTEDFATIGTISALVCSKLSACPSGA